MLTMGILQRGCIGVTSNVLDWWTRYVKDCACAANGRDCCCAHGVGLMQAEAERIAVNQPAIQPHLPAYHPAGTHVLQLMTVDSDGELFTRADEHRPHGKGCAFLREDGFCALHRAADSAGRAIYGLKPEACILYPLISLGDDDLTELYRWPKSWHSTHRVVLDFDYQSHVAESGRRCFFNAKEGDDGAVPFASYVRPSLTAVFGSGTIDALYQAVSAHLAGELSTIPSAAYFSWSYLPHADMPTRHPESRMES